MHALSSFLRRFHPSPALAPVLVIVLLASLALVPIVIQVKIRQLRTDLETIADPARALVTELQFRLSMEAVGARGFMLTGQPSYVVIYREQQRARSEAYASLLPLVRRLGAPVDTETLELGRIFRTADSLLARVMSGEVSVDAYIDQLPVREAAFARATSLVALIDRGLGDLTAALQDEIQAIELGGVVLTGLLVLLALVASGGVARVIEERRRAALQVERVTQSRAALMRGFSHDVKNPLGAADGYLELLESGIMGPVSDKQKESLKRARLALAAALRLIGDLLELARAETITVRRADVDLARLIAELVDEHRGQAATRGLELSADLPGDVGTVSTDETRLRQILANLFSNAIKYTPTGSVRVSVRKRDREWRGREGPWVSIEVTDTGPGLSDLQERALFREYYRAETSAGTDGTGIGLPISRRLARALDGDLTVESAVGRGSTFSVWLPAG